MLSRLTTNDMHPRIGLVVGAELQTFQPLDDGHVALDIAYERAPVAAQQRRDSEPRSCPLRSNLHEWPAGNPSSLDNLPTPQES